MDGLERVTAVLSGGQTDRPPVLPIVHTGLAGLFGVTLGEFFTNADTMAQVAIRGFRRFGFDGVQLSLGVTGEAEALGAATQQPADAAPILREQLLADLARLDELRNRNPAAGGRMPLFFDAVRKAAGAIGDEAFVLATLRGPFLIASQLRGVETILADLLESPEAVERMLAFASDTALRVGRALLAAGAHGVVLGEAVCSPSFISPALYRGMILPHHRRVVAGLKAMGWRFVGLHVCGNSLAIAEDLIATGVDFFDVDYQVPADKACTLVAGRAALRGNLDPSAVFRFGTPDRVRAETERLCREVAGSRWIVSSGCDIPPGAAAENLAACVEAVGRAARPQRPL